MPAQMLHSVFNSHLNDTQHPEYMNTTSLIEQHELPQVSEKFLHHVWKFGWFASSHLTTESGQKIAILHPGTHNHNAGPDFMNARIRIDDTLWWGNVEIHLRASDWRRHNHDNDSNYKNVILHVVLENDEAIFLNTPGDLQVLDLSNCLDWKIWDAHRKWIHQYRWIPCESVIKNAESPHWFMTKDRLLIERLHERVEGIFRTIEQTSGDWSQVALIELCKGFGFKSNSLAMEMLASSVPYKIIARHGSDPLQIEALLFGQAGLLSEEPEDEYERKLHREYELLRKKYSLLPLSKSIWNFGKIRPANSPIVRLSQLAIILSRTHHLVSSMLHLESEALQNLFKVEAHPYWQMHTKFGIQLAKKRTTQLGKNSINQLMVNVVTRLRFAHGKYHNNLTMIDDALALLQTIAPEDNGILREWQQLGVTSAHAGDSQALIQLYSVYCTHEKCIDCPIGISLLKKETHETHTQFA